MHDSPKYGLRFDGQPPNIGTNGKMAYNVAWNMNGLMIKGDYHTVENNLAFDKYNDEVSHSFSGQALSFFVLFYHRKPAIRKKLFYSTSRKFHVLNVKKCHDHSYHTMEASTPSSKLSAYTLYIQTYLT